jgi:hypothetical protein
MEDESIRQNSAFPLGFSTCDHCREPCFSEEGVQVLTPQPTGMFCVPECAAAFIANNASLNAEQKQAMHMALERRHGRRIFAAPSKRYLRTWRLACPPAEPGGKQGMLRDEWLKICWSNLNEQERVRAARDVNFGGESWAIKFRK